MDLERRFDMFLSLQSGSGRALTFTNIDRQEFEKIFKFLYDEKKVPVENAEHLRRTGGRTRVQLVDDDDGSESEDEDFDPNATETRRSSAAAQESEEEESSDDEEDKFIPLDESELKDVSDGKDRPRKRKSKE